jgi:hypothetical protein
MDALIMGAAGSVVEARQETKWRAQQRKDGMVQALVAAVALVITRAPLEAMVVREL